MRHATYSSSTPFTHRRRTYYDEKMAESVANRGQIVGQTWENLSLCCFLHRILLGEQIENRLHLVKKGG